MQGKTKCIFMTNKYLFFFYNYHFIYPINFFTRIMKKKMHNKYNQIKTLFCENKFKHLIILNNINLNEQ